MSLAEDGDVDLRSLTHSFNPFQCKENCFFVALGRLVGVDSSVLAAWIGTDESETDGSGLSSQRMASLVKQLSERSDTDIKLIDFRSPEHIDDYDDLNGSSAEEEDNGDGNGGEDMGLGIAKILNMSQKYCLTGSCLALELKSGGSIGHFVNLQRIKPEIWHMDETNMDGHAWRDESDAKTHYAPSNWKAVDYQTFCHCEQASELLRSGTVRMMAGLTQFEAPTVFGSGKRDMFKGQQPLYQVDRTTSLRVKWEADLGAWGFEIRHHGHWGFGICAAEDQDEHTEFQWRYRDSTPDVGEWLIYEGYWEYSHDGISWSRVKFKKCNMGQGWGAPCDR